MGGDFIALTAQDLVEGLLQVARQQHVTQIVVGKSQRLGLWNLLRGGSVVSRLLRRSGDIDIYAVTPEERDTRGLAKLKVKKQSAVFFPWGEAGWLVATLLLVWIGASFLNPIVGYQSVGIVLLMAVVIAGLFFSRLSVFLLAVLFSFIHNFFFIPPLYTLSIREPQDVLMHFMFFLAAISMGQLTARLKRQNTLIEDREERAMLLFNLARAISEARGIEEVLSAGIEIASQTFQSDIAIIEYPQLCPSRVAASSGYLPDEKEMAVAEWVLRNGVPAGRFTETLSSSASIFFPLVSRKFVVGVMGLRSPQEVSLDYDKKNFAQLIATQIAAGVERERLHESRQKLHALEQTERLYRTLFDSVSHELKTPLTTIQAAAEVVAESIASNPGLATELTKQVTSETGRLQNVVDNMLDMARLESGTLKPNVRTYDLADILGPSLQKIEPIKGKRDVQIEVDPKLPALCCDAPLVVQALSNILHNAIVHTDEGGKIEVSAKASSEKQVEIKIRDNGPGLPSDNPEIVFNRFYREKPEKSGGVGLGLSIAKGFLEVQGGRLMCSNHPRGGALFTIHLPTENC
jgi:two-component system sensor histidine kinase KdpD